MHHRIPLEYAHLFSDVDPNRIRNRVGLSNCGDHRAVIAEVEYNVPLETCYNREILQGTCGLSPGAAGWVEFGTDLGVGEAQIVARCWAAGASAANAGAKAGAAGQESATAGRGAANSAEELVQLTCNGKPIAVNGRLPGGILKPGYVSQGRNVGPDPGVPELLQSVHERYPGHVVSSQIKVGTNGGKPVTDLDAVFQNCVVQVTTKSRAKGFAKQLHFTQETCEVPVFGYAPNMSDSQFAKITQQSRWPIIITNDFACLLDAIAP